jgi:hypothetical protein
MRGWSRCRRVAASVVLPASLTLAAVAFGSAVVGAQTATTTPPTTTPPTTLPVTTTAGGTTGTTQPATGTTAAPTSPTTAAADVIATNNDDSGSDIPWVPIAIAVLIVLAIIIAVIVWSRRRGARAQAAHAWRGRAADATAEIGATARLLSAGEPATVTIAQQILTSLRAFDDLAADAPDDAGREAAQRGRRIVQSLGQAVDADYSIRRSQPAEPDRLEGSAQMLRSSAADSDRALRALYRGFTETS